MSRKIWRLGRVIPSLVNLIKEVISNMDILTSVIAFICLIIIFAIFIVAIKTDKRLIRLEKAINKIIPEEESSKTDDDYKYKSYEEIIQEMKDKGIYDDYVRLCKSLNLK